MEKTEIHLSPIEETSYWWTNSIRDRVREIVIYGAQDDDELAFSKIFFGYTEKDWRNFYLELGKYISFDVANYIPRDRSYSLDSFNQDTAIGGHDRLNEELSIIVGQQLPDIRLASKNLKDSVIYTTNFCSNVWYKSCGITKLPTKYEPSYILTGDEQTLDFYNLLLATIAVLERENSFFQSIPILRESFCREFESRPNTEEEIESVIEMFNRAFNKIGERGIILGRAHEKTYFPDFHDIDFVGLESYMALAKHYADVILLRKQGGDKEQFCKKLRKQEEKLGKNN